MASLVKRGKKYYVVYMYTDTNGKRHQKWESFQSSAEAKARKKEVEYKTAKDGTMFVTECRNLEELLKEYVSLYGKQKWAMSTYAANTSLIGNYIVPYIGKMKLSEISTRVLEKYYREMLKKEAVMQPQGKNAKTRYVSTATVRDIHKILRSAFRQAVKWELMEKNPATLAEVPKHDPEERTIWDAETIFRAIDVCKDERLKLALHLTFACSLRIGELLGLTWDCVDISEKSLAENCASIKVNKELQRVDRKSANEVDNPEILMVFPLKTAINKTELVLKSPKTASSVRRIFLPLTVAEMLIEWRKKQEYTKDALGDEYNDFNMVFVGPLGYPIEASRINFMFRKLIRENDLPPVVFHSLRHSSITYKLKLNGGDVKAVQGDSGHAQASMVTEVYSHIIDEDRKNNAHLFEKEFYSRRGKTGNSSKTGADSAMTSQDISNTVSEDQEMLLKILSNPEMAGVLKALMSAIGK